jgi:hypothetical protein
MVADKVLLPVTMPGEAHIQCAGGSFGPAMYHYAMYHNHL